MFSAFTTIIPGLTGPIDGETGSWFALTKGAGKSKFSSGSLGSFGHGSKAPFTYSSTRTVFYYSRIKNGRGFEDRFQGKAFFSPTKTQILKVLKLRLLALVG